MASSPTWQSRPAPWAGRSAHLDPPHRASRHFPHQGGQRSIHPDAFGILRKGDTLTWAFLLEWERRAVRPATMAQRLAPYLRYYSTPTPTDDHGVRPDVLVVFDDDIAAGHFLRLAEAGDEDAPACPSPCGSPTGTPSTPWDRWDRPGALLGRRRWSICYPSARRNARSKPQEHRAAKKLAGLRSLSGRSAEATRLAT